MRKLLGMVVAMVAVAWMAAAANPGNAAACAGLIGSNGNVNLGRTTTLAAYSDGVEHYVTSFQFLGGGGEFGSLIPLPGIPTKVERGGKWTLQRLNQETALKNENLAFSTAGTSRDQAAEVILEVRIDALDITVLKGGSESIAVWAKEHGFRLSPDAPEVLDYYAQRSQIFLAAVFSSEAAAERGQEVGEGTPIHITIPTDNPWVPLRILSLGKPANDLVEADVYLLTDRQPDVLPRAGFALTSRFNGALSTRSGLQLLHSEPATDELLADLRSDDGMAWVPERAWLTKIGVNSRAGDLRYDLAVDADGGTPSAVAAGLQEPSDSGFNAWLQAFVALGVVAGGVVVLLVVARRIRSNAQAL